MRLGCMLYSLGRSLSEGKLTVPEALGLIKSTGGEGVDISQWHVKDFSHPQVRQMVYDAGLVIASYIGGANITMDDSLERSEALDQMRRIIDAAAEVGTKLVLLTTGGCAPGQDRTEGRRNVARGLAQLIPHAQSCGVVLTIEDFGSPLAPYQTGAECLECCELAGPELKITYDTGNMVMGDEDPVEFLSIVKDRVVHCHAKDWELLPPDAQNCLTSRAGRKYIGTVVGQGVLDYPHVIQSLRDINYNGFVSFEYEGRNDPVEALQQGMAYLYELMETTQERSTT